MKTGPALTLLACCFLSAPIKPVAADAPLLRIAVNPTTLWGWMRESGADPEKQRQIELKRKALDYYQRLGFTHVSYGLDGEFFDHLKLVNGHWKYDHGLHGGGADSSMRAMKKEVEKRGMILLPQLSGLSHMDPFIQYVDSGFSEFAGWNAFYAFCRAKGLPAEKGVNHVAEVGSRISAEAFEEELSVIKAAWKGSAAPIRYVHIGYDELGYDSVCFVKAGKSMKLPATASELVAAEIADRASRISGSLGDSVGILIYGDSFLPTDLGERYGLMGDPITGEGGVLRIAKDKYHLQDRLIVIPWNYILENGDIHYWSRLKYDKERQITFLERLGFGFIPGPGEQGSNNDAKQKRFAVPFALGMPQKTARCMLEWVAAARMHPRFLKGWAHQSYEPFDLCDSAKLCADFSAPLLAYTAWIYPAGKDANVILPPKAILDRVDYKRSRAEERWTRGVHYP